MDGKEIPIDREEIPPKVRLGMGCIYVFLFIICVMWCVGMVQVWQAEENSVESFLAFHIYTSSQD